MRNKFKVVDGVVYMEARRSCTGEILTFKCDVADLELLKQYPWRVHRKSPSIHGWYKVGEHTSNTTSLQKALTGSKFVDFLNGDVLDFRRSNIAPIEKQKRNIPIGKKLIGNKIDVDGDTATVWTSKGDSFIIDSADVEAVKQYTWFLLNTGYPATWIPGGRKGSKQMLLHRFLTGAKKGEEVDHINRDRTNARRSNLRLCSSSENKHNCGICKNNTSGVTGVRKASDTTWKAMIMIDHEERSETFPTFEQALAQRREWEETLNPAGLN